ncbi:MAG TPA: M14 family metallopeptidase [Gemmatimonadales bacterium]|nr:M14 family metallopeptidase [Gemmatimonadales bacterium]
MPSLALLLTIAALTQQAGALRIGSAAARLGEKASGFIDVPAGVDSGTRIPLTIVRGKEPGPTLALIAGTHGSEVAPIIALQRLRRDLDPTRLRGTVLLVHVANLPSFLRRTIYYSPIDGKNLNRVYPGKRDGTVSERIADAITREIIERADYLVDIHAGDGNESLRPYTYWSPLGLNPRADSIAREMALAWGTDYVVIDTARPRDPAASVYTQNTAHLRGKPALTTEAGYLGIPAEDMVQRNVQGAFRLLRYLRMLAGDVEQVPHPLWFDRAEVLRSPGTGIWYPLVERGHAVQKGTVMGVVTDFFGNTLAEIPAPFAGVVLYVVATPAISQGEPLGMVGHPVEER